MSRPRNSPLVLALFFAALLMACDGGTEPTPTSAPQPATPTRAAALPTVTRGLGVEDSPAATQAPSDEVRVPPSPIPTQQTVVVSSPIPAPTPIGVTVTGGELDIADMIAHYFQLFYEYRTLERGRVPGVENMNPNLVGSLAGGVYRDYTLRLLLKDIHDAANGLLIEVSYSDVAVTIDEWQPDADGGGKALVTVRRTKHETRKDAAPTHDMATLRYRLVLSAPNGQWQAVDMYNEATGHWVSEMAAPAPEDVASEIRQFFEEFYEARSLAPGGEFDLDRALGMTALTYQEYALPKLEGLQREVAEGKLVSISYTDISTEIMGW